MDFAAHEAPPVGFKRPRGMEGEAGACEALLALFHAPVSRAEASTAPRAPARGPGSHKRPSEAACTPASLRPQDPQEMAGSYHQSVYPYGHPAASNGAREEQARRQHVRQSAMRGRLVRCGGRVRGVEALRWERAVISGQRSRPPCTSAVCTHDESEASDAAPRPEACCEVEGVKPHVADFLV